MYATVHQFRRAFAREDAGWGRMIAAELSAGADCLGACTVAQLAGASGVVVTCWPDRALAAATPPSSAWTWLGAGVYRVEFTGSAPGEPAVAQLAWFDGPRRAELAEAGLRAGRDRIWPAVRQLAGIGDSYVLRGDDGASLVLGFADRVETIEAAQRAVMGTELLPGEDAALLPGPDRIELHRVVFAGLPAPAMAGGSR
jgi:hypothetical protein